LFVRGLASQALSRNVGDVMSLETKSRVWWTIVGCSVYPCECARECAWNLLGWLCTWSSHEGWMKITKQGSRKWNSVAHPGHAGCQCRSFHSLLPHKAHLGHERKFPSQTQCLLLVTGAEEQGGSRIRCWAKLRWKQMLACPNMVEAPPFSACWECILKDLSKCPETFLNVLLVVLEFELRQVFYHLTESSPPPFFLALVIF
jgi:hypothetical protein